MFTEKFSKNVANFKKVVYHSGVKAYNVMFFIMYKYKCLSFCNYYIL